PDRIFYDASTIKDNYHIPEELEKIKAYCIDDADDSLALWDLMIPPTFYYAQIIPMPLQKIINTATGSQINSIMIRSYIQTGHSIPKSDDKVEYQGAISYGCPGVYKNLIKSDVSSLYPSIIITYKIENRLKDPRSNFLYIVNK